MDGGREREVGGKGEGGKDGGKGKKEGREGGREGWREERMEVGGRRKGWV